jgi:hypothetical protein
MAECGLRNKMAVVEYSDASTTKNVYNEVKRSH